MDLSAVPKKSHFATLVLFFAFFGAVTGHECVHEQIAKSLEDMMSIDDRVTSQPYTGHETTSPIENLDAAATARGRRLSSFSNIRIKLDTSLIGNDALQCTSVGQVVQLSSPTTSSHTCTSEDIMTPEKIEHLNTVVLPQAIQYLQSVLSVVPVSGTLFFPAPFSAGACSGARVNYACCAGVQPSTTATAADYVLFVTARPTSGSTIAWALACSVDQKFRPITGHANFGPARLSTSARARNQQVSVAVHELMHALGFSSSWYSRFRAPDGSLRPRSTVVSAGTFNGKQTQRIILPTVIQKAKEHFGCDNWPDAGLELEDGGSSGTAGSHWEKRIMRNEGMTGTVSNYMVFSAMTLALFADSGYYSVDFTKAQDLAWGKKQGCTFLQSRCSQWSSSHFCASTSVDGCSVDRLSVGYCDLASYSGNLPSPFQYFTDPKRGGRDSYADYCPYYARASDGDCRNLGIVDSGTPRSILGEAFCPTCRCFTGTHSQLDALWPPRARCHQMSCAGGRLTVTVGSQAVTCPADGGEVTVSGSFGGKITCPPFEEVCTGNRGCPSECSGHGTCQSDGTCLCADGWSTASCAVGKCPSSSTSTDCSGHGTCNTATATCTCTSPFFGAACSIASCSPAPNVPDCSGHGTCNTATAACTCNATYFGPHCEKRTCEFGNCTDLPGASQGVCDNAFGACLCARVPSLASDVTTAIYGGADCSGNATELSPVNMTIATDLVLANVPVHSLGPRRYHHFALPVDSQLFSVDIRITPTDPSAANAGELLAYASFGTVAPSSQAHQYRSSAARTGADHSQRILLCGSGATEAECVGRTDVGISSTGTLHIAVLNTGVSSPTKTIPFRVTATRDPCASSLLRTCSGHGTCQQGACICTGSWTGFNCASPNCPGEPDCNGRGTCSVINLTPTCVCPAGGIFSGADCGEIEQSARVTGVAETAAVSSYGTFNKTGTLQVSEWHYVPVVLPQQNGSVDALFFTLASSSPLADPMLLASRDTTPSLAAFDAFAATAWAAPAPAAAVLSSPAATGLAAAAPTTATLIALQSAGARRGQTWFVGVRNNVFGRSPLQYHFSVSARTAGQACPPGFASCSGHGTCVVPTTDSQSVCTCDNAPASVTARGGIEYMGPQCDRPVRVLGSGAPVPVSLQPGEWFYAVVTVGASTRLRAALRAAAPSPGAVPLMLQSSTGLPELTQQALVDIGAVLRDASADTASQTITTSGAALSAQRYFLAVHNSAQATGPVFANLTATLSSPSPLFPATCEAANTAAAAEYALERGGTAAAAAACPESGTDRFCNCHGSCRVVGGAAQCQCASAWQGESCAAPRLRALQKLLVATQSISRLCNLCSEVITMARDQWKVYRIPQPLQKDTGLNISIVASANASDADLYISEVLPRSVFSFHRIAASDGAADSLLLVNRSRSGRFYLGIYAKTDGVFTLTSARQELPATKDDRTFFKELFNWVTTTQAGQLTAACSGIILICICAGCTWRVCSNPDDRDATVRAMNKMGVSMRNLHIPDTPPRTGGQAVELPAAAQRLPPPPPEGHRGSFGGVAPPPPEGHRGSFGGVAPPPPEGHRGSFGGYSPQVSPPHHTHGHNDVSFAGVVLPDGPRFDSINMRKAAKEHRRRSVVK